MAARREAVEAYLAEHHVSTVKWHLTLNNHVHRRTRLNRAVTDCKTYTVAPGSASASDSWRCSLDLPNSFTPNDGIRLQTEGYGSTQKEASEHACHQAVAHLLMTEPSQFLLRPAHWRISLSALLEGLPVYLPGTSHQPLPVHVPARSREAGVEAAGQGAASGAQEVAEVDDRIADLLRRCLDAHGGQFDPSRISSKASGQQPGERLLGGSTPGLGGSTTGSTADRSSPIAIAQIGGMALSTVAGHNVVGVRGLDVEALRRQFEPTPSPLSTPSHTNEG